MKKFTLLCAIATILFMAGCTAGSKKPLPRNDTVQTESNTLQPEARIGIAYYHYTLGDFQKAIEQYEKVLSLKEKNGDKELNETYSWVHVYLSLSYAKLGNEAKAIEYWEQVPVTIGSAYYKIEEKLSSMVSLPK